jgi:hypothetical protein
MRIEIFENLRFLQRCELFTLIKVQGSWEDIQELTTSQAKAQVLEILSSWPLFGSSFFAVYFSRFLNF